MFEYALVLGAKQSNVNALAPVIEKLRHDLSIHGESKVIYGPSEANEPGVFYVNVSVMVKTNVSFQSFKAYLSSVERYCSLTQQKLVDIDIIIQKNRHELMFISDKLKKFCHCLLTINDILPDVCIPEWNKTVAEALSTHPNSTCFKEITLS